MKYCFWLVVALALPLAAGCNKTPPAEPAATDEHGHDHDHGHSHGHDHSGHDHGGHDHAALPKDFHEAVEAIEAARDTIRDSLAAGEKEKADAALHELGHLLEHLPGLIQATKLSDEAKAAAKKDVDELFAQYGKLDEQIHGNLEITYDQFGEKIDAAIERLHEQAHE